MIQVEPTSFSDRQQDVLDRINARRTLRGVRELNNAELDREYHLPKNSRKATLKCVVCGIELSGDEENGSSGKCFECKERERTERNKALAKRKAYQRKYAEKKRHGGELPLKKCKKCGNLFIPRHYNVKTCSYICRKLYSNEKSAKRIRIVRMKMCAEA